MEKKRVLLGVEKKKLKSRKKKKQLLRNVIHYLKSDSYMYAPLLSSPLKRLPQSLHSGQVFSEPKKRDAKRLVDRIVDYLKSDSHLYAPLIVSKSTPSPTTVTSGPSRQINKVSVGDSSMNPSAKHDHRSRNESVHATKWKPNSRGLSGGNDQQTLGYRETVEDMVYQYSSVSGA